MWISNALLSVLCIVYATPTQADLVINEWYPINFTVTASFPDLSSEISSTNVNPSSTPVNIDQLTNGPPTLTLSSANSSAKYLVLMDFSELSIVHDYLTGEPYQQDMASFNWIQANMTVTEGPSGKQVLASDSGDLMHGYWPPLIGRPGVHNITIQVFEQTPQLMSYLGPIDWTNSTVMESWEVDLRFLELGFEGIEGPALTLLDFNSQIQRGIIDFTATNTSGDPNAPIPTWSQFSLDPSSSAVSSSNSTTSVAASSTGPTMTGSSTSGSSSTTATPAAASSSSTPNSAQSTKQFVDGHMIGFGSFLVLAVIPLAKILIL